MTNITLHKLRCQGCGASVPVKEGQRYLDCTYCGSRLEIVAPAKTEDAAPIPEIEALRLRDQLRELDHAWNIYFQEVSVPTTGGLRRAPDLAYVTERLAGGLFSTFMLSILFSLLSPWWGAVIAPAGLLLTWVFVSAAKERQRAFEAAQTLYYNERDELLAKLGTPMGTVPH